MRALHCFCPALDAARSAFLAESVYDGVKAKIKRLQEDARQKEEALGALQAVGGWGACLGLGALCRRLVGGGMPGIVEGGQPQPPFQQRCQQ